MRDADVLEIAVRAKESPSCLSSGDRGKAEEKCWNTATCQESTPQGKESEDEQRNRQAGDHAAADLNQSQRASSDDGIGMLMLDRQGEQGSKPDEAHHREHDAADREAGSGDTLTQDREAKAVDDRGESEKSDDTRGREGLQGGIRVRGRRESLVVPGRRSSESDRGTSPRRTSTANR